MDGGEQELGYGTYETTHRNILKCGRDMFIQNGYERTNVRDLCKAAGITHGSFYRHFESKEALFGALVQPAIDGFYKLYHSSEEMCFDKIEIAQVKDVWEISDENLCNVIKLIYKNFDSFKLLLKCSDGTRYSSFLDDIVNLEVQNNIKMLRILHEQGITVHDLCEHEFRMLTYAYLSCIFEEAMRDGSEEETLAYVHTVVEFFNAGWQKVLGL